MAASYGRSVHDVYDKRAVWRFLCRFFLPVGDRKNTATSACRRLGGCPCRGACRSTANTGAREPRGGHSIFAERNQKPDQNGGGLDQFGPNPTPQFLPAGNLAPPLCQTSDAY